LIFLKLGFKQNEIAFLMGISSEGVKRARQRLSKKLGLESAAELSGFIKKF
jgi:DNA-binding NarL/FixJ family response regulator